MKTLQLGELIDLELERIQERMKMDRTQKQMVRIVELDLSVLEWVKFRSRPTGDDEFSRL